MEVLAMGEAGSPTGGGGEYGAKESGSRVTRLASDLYNMFVSEGAEGAALPVAMVPTTPAAPVVPGAPQLPSPRTPVATGCAMKGVTKTVIVIAGLNGSHERMRAALERTKPAADIARKHGNQLHVVFLGGALPPHGAANEGVVDWMLALKRGSKDFDIEGDKVHLIVGPREIQALSTVASEASLATDPSVLAQYLRASKFIECLGPESMDDTGAGGLWLKATSTQGGAIVGKLPGVGVMGAAGPRAEWIDAPALLTNLAWKNELNKRWLAATLDPAKLRDKQPSKWQFWMTIGVQSALDQELLPAEGLGTEASRALLVTARQTAAFGAVRRTLMIDKRSLLMLPGACWMDVGVTSDSLYWAVQTWCFSTMRDLNAHRLPIADLTPAIDDLQFDVASTLSSLVQHAEGASALAPAVRPWANLGALRGQLGPCVCAGRGGRELLRVVQWSTPGSPDVVMLLPEHYLRFVFRDYYQDMVSMQEMGARAVAGFLVLHDENIIPMKLPNLSEAEQLDAGAVLGARLWKLGSRPAVEPKKITDEIIAAPSGWRRMLQYSVDGVDASNDLIPGRRVRSAAGRHVFYTHTTTADALAGLRVRWVFAPGAATANARDMPTLDVANDNFQRMV